MKVGRPGEGCWPAGPTGAEQTEAVRPARGGLPDGVPAGTLLAMALRRVPRPRTHSYELEPERGPPPGRIQGLRWTPLNDTDETLNSSPGLATVLRAAKLLYSHLLDTCPALVRDRKYHLRLYRQCCSGRELVDGLLATGLGIQSRSQAVGICQVLLDEGALHHVKDDWHFQDRDAQFYRFSGPELGGLPGEVPGGSLGGEREAEELAEAMGLLSQRGSDALLTMALRKPLGQRSDEELELIFEELLHIKAVAHLSNSVKRELAAVLLFESHRKAGTVRECVGGVGSLGWGLDGDICSKQHGSGLVTTLHEGDAFGQLALVNEAPRAATIVLREDNCHFLRVDKRDFTRILKDMEAKTLRLEEHGKVVLVLEREPQGTAGTVGLGPWDWCPPTSTVGTPSRLINGHPLLLADTFLGDFLLTHGIFMPSTQLCAALLHQYPLPSSTFHAEPATGSETDRSLYVGHRRQQILHLVSQWVALYGPMLDADPAAPAFLQKLSELVSRDARLCQLLREQGPEKRWPWGLENGGGNGSSQMKVPAVPPHVHHQLWPPSFVGPLPNCTRPPWLVPYAVCRPDHEVLTVLLPVTASVREVTAALAQVDSRTGDPVLVKVNSSGEAVKLPPDARGVASSLGLNERLFLVSAQEPAVLTPHPDQLGPNVGSAELLDAVSSRDLASLLSEYDWGLFHCVHQVEPILYVLGPQRLRDITTANLERLMRRFNELQYWVVTELCLCPAPAARARLLSRFIKLAAHLKEQRNLNSFFAVMFGLSNSAVSRLAHTWERLPHKIRKLHSSLEQLLDPSWNHRVYRLALAKLSPPIIPFMPLLLKGNVAPLDALNKYY
uniref:Rap guanine nucleotide exchange factor 3 n=1 Tax=Ornithorhynchus anatinus TaxID=9258 RepID=A0A6I8PI17_ORNAN